jgi:putative ABC transport system permease protein
VLEFALALVLMIAASLLLHSFWDLTRAPLGFNPRDVTVVHTRLPYPNDPNEDLYATAANEEPFVRELLRRTGALPGVEEVALGAGGAVPLDHPQQDQEVLRVLFEGRPAQAQPAFVNGAEVTPGFFRLLGIRLVRGRLFTDFETDRAPPVVVINEAMARAYWPNQDPIGRRLRLSQRSPVWFTVVGIVANARTESLSNAGVPQLYASIYQRRAKHLAIFLRGHFETAAIARGVEEQVQAVNRALPVFGTETLSDAVSSSLARRRFAMELIALFAATALLLACIGVYGVMAYLVSERTHEIGVRVALGASRGDVVSSVLRQGVRLALIGSLAGLAASLVVARLMSSILYGVTSRDPLTFVSATLILGAAAVAACYMPARSALHVDPVIALRS